MCVTDPYTVSADPSLLDVDAVHAYLTRSYWAEGIGRELVARCMANSVCVGAYHESAGQVGFARVITDRASFAYLCDVYVLEDHRGHGLARKMTETLLAHSELQGLRRWVLVTKDAHGVYARCGFVPLASPEGYMEIARPGLYLRSGAEG